MTQRRILIVDDENGIRFALRNYLEGCGYEVREVEDIASCRMAFRDWRPDAIVLDYKLPDGTALDLVEPIKAFDPSITIIVLTGHGSIELAVQSMKDGADHFMTKPIELSVLAAVLEKSLALQRSRRRDLVAKSSRTEVTRDPFIGKSRAIARLREDARRVLDSDLPVLIEGETGSGKGVVAEWIHQAGPRCDAAFVDLNCAGLSKEFLESELFGHEKGAFTGAVGAKQGLLELAHAGSVFFDEIGDMDILVQAKILKVVEAKKFRRLGDVRDRSVDIRLIAASHLNLVSLVGENKFRSDLYFRISTLPLVVPPLRERVDDIPEIAEHLLKTAGRDGRHLITLTREAVRALQAYQWPGNIRELRNVLERALLLSENGGTIDARHLQFTAMLANSPSRGGTGMTLEELERGYICDVLNEVGGKVDVAAGRLGIPRSSLYQKLKKYGLSARGV
jgi:DNA-binding NtrC family response regulator